MKKYYFVLFLIVLSSQSFADCAEEAKSAAIYLRAQSAPSNVDFIASSSLVSKKGHNLVYHISVEPSADSSADDFRVYLYQVTASELSGPCRIVEIKTAN